MFVRLIAIALLFAALAACEKPTHENIDKWKGTEHGPKKLADALANEGLDPDLAAHAGVNLIKLGRDADVKDELGRMQPARRDAVVAKMAAREWDAARVDSDMSLPNPEQVQAKDALVMLRKLDAASHAQIDVYLIDWFCVASYERRAETGNALGAPVIRMIGPAAGKKLMAVVDGLLTAPAKGNAHARVGDELLVGLAASGNPDGVKYLVDLAKMKTADPTLPMRALEALYKAYVDPNGELDVQAPDALAANLAAFTAIARDPDAGDAAAYAIKLIRTIGPPACIAPLVGLVGYPHPNPKFKLTTADSALKCGGIPAIKDVVHALPDASYSHDDLNGAVIADLGNMKPTDKVIAVLRELLAEKGRIPRWVAIEGLAALKSAADAPAIAAVSSSEKLVGYWGDQSGVAVKDRKPDPTLGQRAKELAALLAGAK
ncbi:MAG TPA: hypothetical protein VH143_24315 [Kofleriaceae bacterium]|jgi:hypothetical protein|nr:hypothetical protein [Kofleriaceae bacterium]